MRRLAVGLTRLLARYRRWRCVQRGGHAPLLVNITTTEAGRVLCWFRCMFCDHRQTIAIPRRPRTFTELVCLMLEAERW